jgi:anti-sigma B factor antagonist
MSAEDFKIEIKPVDADESVQLITVSGYLDAHTFEQLEETINDLYNQEVYRIVVDLSEVQYISSAGAGVFIGALQTAQDHDGNIVLMRPSESVREVFDLLGLTQIFSLQEDLDGALESFDA